MSSSVGRRCGPTGERRQRFLRKGRRLSTKPMKGHSTCCQPRSHHRRMEEDLTICRTPEGNGPHTPRRMEEDMTVSVIHQKGMDHLNPEKRIKNRRPLGLYVINNINKKLMITYIELERWLDN